ncbi:MAG: hypothetical protein GX607_01455 [Myxococcales bacterium]|nr:hypothetical protein [Myxococcales bacterium]
MSFPTLTLLIALPALTAVFLRDSERKRLESARVRGIAAGALTLTLLLALAVVFGSDQGSGPPAVEFVGGWAGLRAGPRLAVDAIVLPLLPVTVVLAMAGILGTSRRESTARHARAVLATCSGTLLLQCAADLDTFVVGWFASLLPSWFHARANALEDPRERGPLRILTVYLGLASLPLSLAAISLHVTSASGAELGSVVLHAQRSVTLAPRTQEWILLLLGVTALARKGMVPLHSWVPHLAERGSVALTTQLLGAHAGVLLLLRVAIPLLPDASRSVMALITGAAVVSASYGALMALGQQRSLRRCLGWVAMSQSSLILVGVATMNEQGLAGALLQCVGFSLAFAGVMWAAHFVEVRTGTMDLKRLGGLVGRMPLASGLFFLAAAALVGLPGSIGFVADELLVHAALATRPWVAIPVLLATGLNAISLYRAYTATFLGRPKGRARLAGPLPVKELVGRERWLLMALLALMVVGGVAPSVLLGARAAAVTALSAAASTP